MNRRTVEEVLMDFKGRRAAIIKALTKDVEEFYRLCDPTLPNLCLYAYPDHQWEVNIPPLSDLPEPRLGINFSRDIMKRENWLAMVALHSDAWLHSVAIFLSAKFAFDRAERKRLLSKIADHSSILEAMSGSVARKRVRTENCGLPEEMLVEVLARVSVKDLVQYRSVSKLWRSLIDEREFVSTHLSNYKINSEGSHLLVIETPRNFWKDGQALVRRSDTFRKVGRVHYMKEIKNCACLSYINGVMLIKIGQWSWLNGIKLWNPSINRSLHLPTTVTQGMRTGTSYFVLGFGFDSSHNDYKVISIAYAHTQVENRAFGSQRCRAIEPGLVEVYTLSNNSWCSHINGSKSPPYWSEGKQVFLNGVIHWTNLGPNVRDIGSWATAIDSHVVTFDVANEVFAYFELPRGIDNVEDRVWRSSLTIMDGSLALCRSFGVHHDIWVMKEYGMPGSWSNLYTFRLEIENFLHFKSNGEVIYAIDGTGVLSYDVKKRRVRELAKTFCRTSKYMVFTYVESFVLLHHGDSKLECKNNAQLAT